MGTELTNALLGGAAVVIGSLASAVVYFWKKDSDKKETELSKIFTVLERISNNQSELDKKHDLLRQSVENLKIGKEQDKEVITGKIKHLEVELSEIKIEWHEKHREMLATINGLVREHRSNVCRFLEGQKS